MPKVQSVSYFLIDLTGGLGMCVKSSQSSTKIGKPALTQSRCDKSRWTDERRAKQLQFSGHTLERECMQTTAPTYQKFRLMGYM